VMNHGIFVGTAVQPQQLRRSIDYNSSIKVLECRHNQLDGWARMHDLDWSISKSTDITCGVVRVRTQRMSARGGGDKLYGRPHCHRQCMCVVPKCNGALHMHPATTCRSRRRFSTCGA
jgi:hypothetical protein